MSENIYLAVSSLILAVTLLFNWHKLLNRKIDLRDYKLYITLFGITIISQMNYFMVNKFIKIFIITLVFMLFFSFLFKETLQKNIITPIFYQIIIIISETIFVLLLLVIFGADSSDIMNSFLGAFITNVAVGLISLFVVKLKFIQKMYNKILEFTDKISIAQLYIFCLIPMIIVNVLLMSSYYKIDFVYLLMFNIAVIFVCFILVFYSFKTQNKYNKVSDKYNIAIKSLNDYETMMTKYRISNHENKNLLLTIRAMILNKEKDIPKFIDTMIEDKYADDEKLLFKMSVIPSGGLRAAIYSEILKIKDHDINYSLYIDKKLRTVDLIELDTNTIIDICKIIGVFIDNAIDEVKMLEYKNIGINLYLDKSKINIKISNNYKSKIDINVINKDGYTTKGEGHGYGLSLVETIINNNGLLENKTEISNKCFSQIVSVKYKKSQKKSH